MSPSWTFQVYLWAWVLPVMSPWLFPFPVEWTFFNGLLSQGNFPRSLLKLLTCRCSPQLLPREQKLFIFQECPPFASLSEFWVRQSKKSTFHQLHIPPRQSRTDRWSFWGKNIHSGHTHVCILSFILLVWCIYLSWFPHVKPNLHFCDESYLFFLSMAGFGLLIFCEDFLSIFTWEIGL